MKRNQALVSYKMKKRVCQLEVYPIMVDFSLILDPNEKS